MSRRARIVVVTFVLLISGSVIADADFAVRLKSGSFEPPAMAGQAAQVAAGLVGKHVLIQFDRILTDADKESLRDAGIELLDYVPDNSWIASIRQAPQQSRLDRHGVRWLGAISSQQKLSRRLTDMEIQPSARRGGDQVQFVIVLHRDENAQQWSQQFASRYGASIVGIEPTTNSIDLIIPEAVYRKLADLDAVQWVEPALPEPQELNNSARTNLGVNIVQAAPYNLTGENIVVAEWDGGSVAASHPDFSGRVTVLDGSAVSLHSTHVAGTVMGDGSRSSGTYKGMAPAASLLSQQWWNSGSEALGEYQTVITNYGANISTNSWGYGVGSPATQSACEGTMGDYYSVCATLDNIVRGAAASPISICWAAGNERSSGSQYCGSLGWTYGTIGPPGTAKNTITVGAVNSNNSTMTSFSSWGPTDDGRLKPDIVGPGCQSNDDGGVTSCNTTTGYATMCGTSMSTPAVAGLVTLMYQQRWLSAGTTNMLASTVKGILTNSATDLGQTGPDYQYGYGLANAERAIKKVAIGTPSWVEGIASTGTTIQYDLVVPSGASKLKVTLAWDDPGSTAMSGSMLINDLDVVLIDPFGTETKPWILSPSNPAAAATRGIDRINNVEMAEVSNPQAGLWKARVTGYNIPQGPQKYSLVFTPDSIYQPGNTRAMSVVGPTDRAILPGNSTTVGFWVGNVGGSTDSIRVRISDSRSWLAAGKDTILHLIPYDSAYLEVSASVPAQALVGDSTIISCRANSQSDTNSTALDKVVVNTAAVYMVSVPDPAPHTARSPENYVVTLKIRNQSNIANAINVQPSSADGWLVMPSLQGISLNPRDSGSLSFTVNIPEEVADQSSHTIVFIAIGNGNVGDTAALGLTVQNPVFPPTLTSPDTVLFTRNRMPSFQWSGSADTYTLLIGTDTNMTTVLRSFPGLTSTSFTLPSASALNDGQYFWAVKKYVSGDSSSIQRYPRRLVVDNIAPVPLEIYSPGPGAILSNKTVTFVYSEANNSGPNTAPEYGLLQVASDSGFTQVLATIQPVTGTSYQYPDTLAEGRWWWRTQRLDLAGNVSVESSAPSFIVDSRPPNLPVPLSPNNGAVVSSLPAKLRWQGTPPAAWVTSREFYYMQIASDSGFSTTIFGNFVYADSLLLDAPLLVQGNTYFWRVKAIDSADFYTAYTAGRSFKYLSYICGDINQSFTNPDLTDLSMLISYLLTGQPSLPVRQAASFNCDETIDLVDLSTLIAYLVGQSVTLCCPQ